jgi:PAS domain S-box-containing protein
MLPSEQDSGEVILSEEQVHVLRSAALHRREPFDKSERAKGVRDDDPYYDAFFDRKVEGVLLATTAGELLDASDVACRLLGCAKEELVGKEVGGLFDPLDPRLTAAWERQRRTGFFKGELRVMRRADGMKEPFDASVALTSYRTKPGEDQILIVLRDPVEQREAAEPRRGTEEWFFSLASYASDVIQLRNTDGTCRYTSPSTESAWGYAPEEVMGAVELEIVHPEEVERVRAEFAQIWARPGIGPPVEFRIRHKDGHWLHLEASANNLRDDPEVRGMLIIYRDVTARVGMLRESLDMFRTTFEQAAVGLAHMDLDGRWIRLNERLAQIFGYSRKELLRKNFDDITLPEDDADANRDRMKRLLSGEIDEYSMEKRCLRKDDSEVWVSLNVSLVRHPSGEPAYFIAVVEDIDERKRAELILRSLSGREIEVLKLLSRGLTNRQIAGELYISDRTVKFHVQHVIEKLRVTDRTQAAFRAAELGLVS